MGIPGETWGAGQESRRNRMDLVDRVGLNYAAQGWAKRASASSVSILARGTFAERLFWKDSSVVSGGNTRCLPGLLLLGADSKPFATRATVRPWEASFVVLGEELGWSS